MHGLMATPYLPPSVATPLPYFISEQLFVRDLEHVRSVPLLVVTVRPPSGDAGHHGNTEGTPTLPEVGVASTGPGDRKRKWVESSDTAPGVKNRCMSSSMKDEQQPLAGGVVSGCGHKQEPTDCMAQPQVLAASASEASIEDFDLKRVLALSSAWVLDFDLDFFSTGNPFTEGFSTVR